MLRRDMIRLGHKGQLSYNAKPRSYPTWKRQLIEEFVQTGLKNDWIEPSNSRVSLEIVFVFKEGKPPRPCIDCRPYNEQAIPVVYAPETGIGLRTWIQEHRYFTEYDAKKAFYRMTIHPKDRWKIAFRTPFGKYQPIAMPFGLAQAPGEYQMWLESVLHGLIGRICHVHIDNILVCSNDPREHKKREQAIEQRLQQAKIEYEMTQRMTTEIRFCGIIYGPTGSRTAYPAETIRTWPEPRNKKELQRFLGIATWNADWAPKLHHVAWQLWEATAWTNEERTRFHYVKMIVSQEIETAPHDPWDYATMITDASDFALAAILFQKQRPTAIYSRKFSQSERHYGAPDKELLAITEALTRWHDILKPSKGITIRTDNEINTKNINTDTPNPRKARQVEIISYFRTRMIHIEGERNPADAPSRRPDYVFKRVPPPPKN